MKQKQALYQLLALRLGAYQNCKRPNKGTEDWGKLLEYWASKHEEVLQDLVTNHMPSGAGFDQEIRLDLQRSSPDKLIFESSYHVMDDAGQYYCWVDYRVVVTPSLAHHINLRVYGDFKGLYNEPGVYKEHIIDCFGGRLMKEIALN